MRLYSGMQYSIASSFAVVSGVYTSQQRFDLAGVRFERYDAEPCVG